MAYTDANTTFDNGVALTVTRVSTNVVDLNMTRDIGSTNEPMQLLFQFGTLPTASGAATVTVLLETSADNSTFIALATSATVGKAAFTVTDPSGGIRMVLPSITDRYVRLTYTIATGPLTAGTVFAGLVLARDTNRAYARNYTA